MPQPTIPNPRGAEAVDAVRGLKGQVYEVESADRVIKFRGELIADVVSQPANLPRWTEMELFRLTDGTGRYVVHIIGCSVLYHTHNSDCNAGIGTRLADLPEDAEPCPRCRPVSVTEKVRVHEGDRVVDFEVDRHTTHVCASADEAVDRLRSTGARNATHEFSGPALRLLTAAAQRDPAINRVLNVVEEL